MRAKIALIRHDEAQTSHGTVCSWRLEDLQTTESWTAEEAPLWALSPQPATTAGILTAAEKPSEATYAVLDYRIGSIQRSNCRIKHACCNRDARRCAKTCSIVT